MNEQILELFSTAAGAKILHEYMVWHFVSAVVWVIVSIYSIYSGLTIDHQKYKEHEIVFVIRCLMVLVGFAIIGCSVGDIASPEAAAIHQLIMDLSQ